MAKIKFCFFNNPSIELDKLQRWSQTIPSQNLDIENGNFIDWQYVEELIKKPSIIKMVKTENFIQVAITAASQLREWLQNNHTQKESIWLVTYKKEVKEKYVSVQEVLDELLCFGWIDGIRRKLDEQKTMQLISPRQVQHWTKTYKDRFEKLEKEGRMTDAGRQSVLVSKQKGLWNFMDDVDALINPPDFIKCLEDNPPAMLNFNSFGSSSKRFMLRHIKIAKTADTRMKRINEIALLAKQNKKLPGS